MQSLLSMILANYGQEFMRPGLERIERALKDILPHFSKSKVVIIAGTNGKGETTLRLSRLLKGRSHFVWTSPHIERITERFRNEEGEIPLKELRALVESCHQRVQNEKLELSFYEFLFFVFCTWASKNPPEFLLLEVGLGGKLDAVNVFSANLVLLPSVSRDHQEILGRRFDQILAEKLGTLRSGSVLIHFLNSQYLADLAQKEASRVGAKVMGLKDIISVPEYEFSIRNEALAGAAYCHLTNQEFLPERWVNPVGLLEFRGEVLKGHHEWIFFGSHNVDGVRKLIQFLHSGTYTFSRPPYDLILMAFSRRNLQDVRVMLKMVKKARLGKIVITIFDHPKAMPLDVMEAISLEEGLEFVQNIESYINEQNKNLRILVAGSYYFIGHFRSLRCL